VGDIFARSENNLEFLYTFSQKSPTYNFTKNHPVGAALRYADGHTQKNKTKIIGSVRD
jgi:hypothetical protein